MNGLIKGLLMLALAIVICITHYTTSSESVKKICDISSIILGVYTVYTWNDKDDEDDDGGKLIYAY